MSKTWDYYGKNDPYFGVLSAPEYHGQLDESGRERFFASGAVVVERFLGIAESRFGPVARGAALDYGCGVGRLSKNLATRFSHVTGADISPHMLLEARRNIGETSQVTLVPAGQLGGEPRFDFLMSSIVFQHIEPATGYEVLRRISRLLKQGAVGVIDIPVAYTGGTLRRVLRGMRAAIHQGKPIIPMYWYSQHTILQLLKGFDVQMDHYDSYPFRYAVIAFRRTG